MAGAKEIVWISPLQAMTLLGWSTDDKKATSKLKNAFQNRVEFKNAVEMRQIHPDFPDKRNFVRRDAVIAYAKALQEEALHPRSRPGRGENVGPKVFRLNVTAEQAAEISEFLTSQGFPALYRYTPPKRERKPKPEKVAKSNGVETVQTEVEMVEA